MNLNQYRRLRIGTNVVSGVDSAIFTVVLKTKDFVVLHHVVHVTKMNMDDWIVRGRFVLKQDDLYLGEFFTNAKTLREYVITEVFDESEGRGCIAVASAVLKPNILHVWNVVSRKGK